MGNGIMVREESGELVSWDDMTWEPTGVEDVAPSFPVIKIVQGTSGMEGAGKHGGDFWRSDTEEYAPALTLVPLLRRETRAMFEEGNPQPICMSADGKAPLPNQPLWTMDEVDTGKAMLPVPAIAPRACGDCPFSEWINDTPPVCGLSDVVLVDLGDGDLAQLRISGKSLGVLKRHIARRIVPKKLPLFAHRWHLTTAAKSEGTQKKWHELVITPESLTPGEARAYNETLKLYREQFDARLKQDGEGVDWPEDIDTTTGEILSQESLKARMGLASTSFTMPGMDLFKTQFNGAIDHYKVTETTIAGFLGVAGKKTAWRDLLPIAYDWCEAHEKTANDLVVEAIDSVLNPPQKPLEVDDLPFD